MKTSRLTGLLAILVAMIVVVVTGVALYTSVRFATAEQEARTSVREATAYSRALDRLKDAVLDAETGQRGYLLTGDRDYLEPYLRARSLIEESARDGWVVQALRNGKDEELRSLIEAKLTELDATIRLFDEGKPKAALSVIQTDRGWQYMVDIRNGIKARQEEAQAIAEAAAIRSRIYNERSGLVSTLLAALLGLAILLGGVTIYLWSRTDKAETEAEEATDTAERIEVIARELNHRMKNMFAVAQGMLRQSARGRGEEVEAFAKEATDRITAMSQAYSVTNELDAAGTMSTDEVIDRVVRAQLLTNHRIASEGEGRQLLETAITPLALILHEWTTNTLKYGAWKLDEDDAQTKPDQGVTLRTDRNEADDLVIIWDERFDRTGHPVPTTTGYGSKLIKACAAQLGGSVDYDWHDQGVRITLTVDKSRL